MATPSVPGLALFDAKRCSPDLAEGDESIDMPDDMARELRELGLL